MRLKKGARKIKATNKESKKCKVIFFLLGLYIRFTLNEFVREEYNLFYKCILFW